MIVAYIVIGAAFLLTLGCALAPFFKKANDKINKED
jgi:hypothetical protein